MPEQPLSNPQFNTHKVFATIGIILTVMVIIVGGIFILTRDADKYVVDNKKVTTNSAKPATNSATSDETKDWQTYSNEELGFTFKYPPEWGTVSFTTSPGESGYAFRGTFSTVAQGGALEFFLYTTEWSIPMDPGPIFAYYTNNPDGTYNFHRPDGSVRITFNASASVKTGVGDALIVGGRDASDYVKAASGESLTTPRRFAFINFETHHQSKKVKGLQFVYAGIADSEKSDFDLMISTFSLL